MPIYDYRCQACGHRIEVVHGVHAHGPRTCPNCGAEGTMRKLIAAPAVHFKGSGWAKKDRAATATPGRSQAQKSAESGASEKAAEPTATGNATADKPATGKPATAGPAAGGGATTAD